VNYPQQAAEISKRTIASKLYRAKTASKGRISPIAWLSQERKGKLLSPELACFASLREP
jgi:hypothetical protein